MQSFDLWRNAVADGTSSIGATHRPLRDKVIDELRRRIIDGVYEPGDRLTEERLAVDFGVSRNPVREAIRVLEAEGFLLAQPRRGAVVASMSVQDVVDLFDVRLALETLAAGLAAERIEPDGSAMLTGLLARARGTRRMADLAALNTRFHAAICALAGNQLLAGLMESLHGRLQWVYRQSVATRAAQSWGEHQRLAEAILSRDPDAAGEEARLHVLAARESALAVARDLTKVHGA
jgi:DNA-binding GntR family transcriptional regulator